MTAPNGEKEDLEVVNAILRDENKKLGGALADICKLLKNLKVENKYFDQADLSSAGFNKLPKSEGWPEKDYCAWHPLKPNPQQCKNCEKIFLRNLTIDACLSAHLAAVAKLDTKIKELEKLLAEKSDEKISDYIDACIEQNNHQWKEKSREMLEACKFAVEYLGRNPTRHVITDRLKQAIGNFAERTDEAAPISQEVWDGIKKPEGGSDEKGG